MDGMNAYRGHGLQCYNPPPSPIRRWWQPGRGLQPLHGWRLLQSRRAGQPFRATPHPLPLLLLVGVHVHDHLKCLEAHAVRRLGDHDPKVEPRRAGGKEGDRGDSASLRLGGGGRERLRGGRCLDEDCSISERGGGGTRGSDSIRRRSAILLFTRRSYQRHAHRAAGRRWAQRHGH